MAAGHDLGEARLGVIGAGAMAEAMVSGILARELLAPGRVVCSHPREERRAELAVRHGVSTVEANADAVHGADIVVLAVKPQVLAEVAPELRAALSGEQLLLSVIAGASTAALSSALDHPAVLRAMPNTPATIGRGVTVWYATAAVTPAQKARSRAMLGALGREFEVHDERQVAMATAVSGSGPTYCFLFVEALIDAAVHLGFPRHVARELVLDTVLGSAEYALASGAHVAALREAVTSPAGTSADALYELERGGLRTVVSDAVWAAFERVREIEAALEAGAAPGAASGAAWGTAPAAPPRRRPGGARRPGR